MNDVSSQNIVLENRKVLKLTGIKKIESLNPQEFLLISSLGNLSIKGNELEMQSFDIEKGNMHITGNVDTINYFEKSQTKKNNKGFIQKLFR